ncbi:MAG: hypothetical protein IKO01_06870 [Kiritimatiellae bacterium]|nr:hypothetical protein [Kiritimatiellia bacterium]
MTKRWKMVLGALAVALAWAGMAWGDLVIDEYQYRGGPAWVSDSMGRAMLGAVFGGALVGVAFWPGWLMARVRSGKEAKGHPRIMEYVVLMMLIVAAIVAVGMVFGNLLPNLARQIPMGVWMVCAGEAVLAGVALVCGQRAKSWVWRVASAVVAASAIVLLAWAAGKASPPLREEPPVRPYHYYHDDGPGL